MPSFKYYARDKNGKFISGVLYEDTKEVAASSLKQKGLFIIELRELKPSFFRKWSLLYQWPLINFTKRLSYLLKSGFNLDQALGILVTQTKDTEIRIVLEELRNSVHKGLSLGEALSHYRKIFPGWYTNTVKAGEKGSNLQEIMEHLADFCEQRKQVRSAIISMLAYPLVAFFTGISVIIFIMVYVLPRISVILIEPEHTLPLSTKLLIYTSNFLYNNLFLLIFILGIIVFIFRLAIKNDKMRTGIDKYILYLPLVGEIIKKNIFSRFNHTLSLLIKQGVSLVDSLNSAIETIPNNFIKAEFSSLVEKVLQGKNLSEVLTHIEMVPPYITEMVSLGEKSGRLDYVLLNIAEIYNQEVKEDIRRLLIFLEPMIIFFLALFVGFIVMGVLLPIINFNLPTANF